MSGLAFGQETGDFKMAGIDIQRVFQEFHKTARTEKEINEARIRIQKADRQMRSEVRKVDMRLTEESKKGQAQNLSGEEGKAEEERISKMVADRNKINQERIDRHNANNQQLNRDMMNTMAGLLGEIQRFVEAYAEKGGYDIVFDLSGTSTNQIPPVLGGKALVDITSAVIAELNKGEANVDPKR